MKYLYKISRFSFAYGKIIQNVCQRNSRLFIAYLQQIHAFGPNTICMGSIGHHFYTGKNERAKVSSYRPISILPTPLKVLKKNVRKYLLDWVFEINLIPPEQYGFLPGSPRWSTALTFGPVHSMRTKMLVLFILIWPKHSTPSFTQSCYRNLKILAYETTC